MKSGRAAKWAARIFKWEEDNQGHSRFLDWDEFRMEFQKDFCPAHLDIAAINKLESTTYYQKNRSVDDYLDEFIDLVMEAGYTDPKTIVVKFRKGLDPQIQNTIATMAYGRPSDSAPQDWYEAAKNVNQNHAANKAFKTAFKSLTLAPVCHTPTGLFRIPPTSAWIDPAPNNPVPMDTDVGKGKNSTPPTCYRCRKAGHKAPDCPLKFDIRTMSVEEIEMLLMVRRDVSEVEGGPAEIKEVNLEDFVPNNE